MRPSQGHRVHLPAEIQQQILEILIQDGYKVSKLVTVSRQWQEFLEPRNFARIKLTPARAADFVTMTCRMSAHIRSVWFCWELDDYNCTSCVPNMEHQLEMFRAVFAAGNTTQCPIRVGFEQLFAALCRCHHAAGVTLDLSIHSPSDVQHWFPYLTLEPDPVPEAAAKRSSSSNVRERKIMPRDLPRHRWPATWGHGIPIRWAMMGTFHPVMDDGPFSTQQLEFAWWDQLPVVSSVTRLLLRRQNRRRWKPLALAHIFVRFPNLTELYYEPWRECISMQNDTDHEYESLFTCMSNANRNLKKVVLFENFNQQYPLLLRPPGTPDDDETLCAASRKPSRIVSRSIALASLRLEYLAASFLAEARYFFQTEPDWRWSSLLSLVLTSALLAPNEKTRAAMQGMLQAAAAAAMRMPRLETLQLWNGRKELATLFQYQRPVSNRRCATITWRSTWAWCVDESVVKAWEPVTRQCAEDGDGSIEVVQESVDKTDIKSHADAIEYIRLSEVMRPISLLQIHEEQQALEGVPTVATRCNHQRDPLRANHARVARRPDSYNSGSRYNSFNNYNNGNDYNKDISYRGPEVANDDVEHRAGNTTSSLEDMESKFNLAIERGVIMDECKYKSPSTTLFQCRYLSKTKPSQRAADEPTFDFHVLFQPYPRQGQQTL